MPPSEGKTGGKPIKRAESKSGGKPIKRAETKSGGKSMDPVPEDEQGGQDVEAQGTADEAPADADAAAASTDAQGEEEGGGDDVAEGTSSSTSTPKDKHRRGRRRRHKKKRELPSFAGPEVKLDRGAQKLLKQHMKSAGMWHEALLEDCEEGALESVKAILNFANIKGTDMTDITDSNGRTTLHIAAVSGNFDICDILIETAKDPHNRRTDLDEYVDAEDPTSNTALILACKNMRKKPEEALRIVELLLANGATQEVAQRGTKMTALHWACYNGLADIVEALIREDPSQIAHSDRGGVYPMFHAGKRLENIYTKASISPYTQWKSMAEEVARLKRLLIFMCRATAAYCALPISKEDIVTREEEQRRGGEPLPMDEAKALMAESTEKVTGLHAEDRADLLSSSLYLATLCGDTALVKRLLREHSLDVTNPIGPKGATAVHIAAQQGRVGLLRLFVQEKKDIEDAAREFLKRMEAAQFKKQMGHEPPPLQVASPAEEAAAAAERWRRLLTVVDVRGNTPLHRAVDMANASVAGAGGPCTGPMATPETVDDLIELGGAANVMNYVLLTPTDYMTPEMRLLLKTKPKHLNKIPRVPGLLRQSGRASKLERQEREEKERRRTELRKKLSRARVAPVMTRPCLDVDVSTAESRARIRRWRTDCVLKFDRRSVVSMFKCKRVLEAAGLYIQAATFYPGGSDEVSPDEEFGVAAKPHGDVFLMVMAPHHTLQRTAAAVGFKGELLLHYTRMPYVTGMDHVFAPFRDKDMQALTMAVMEGVFDVREYVSSGIIKSLYAVHDRIQADLLWETWSKTSFGGLLSHPWGAMSQYFSESESNQLLHVGLVQSYFGEKVALYFAWFAFYTGYLLVAALPGLISVAWQGILLLLGFDYASSLDNPSHVGMAIFMMVWSTYFLEKWKRKQSELLLRWDMSEFHLDESVRPQFFGDEAVSPVTGEVTMVYPARWRQVRCCLSVPLLVVFLIMSLASIISLKLYKLTLGQGTAAELNFVVYYSAGLMQGMAITILNMCYRWVADTFTWWENHKTQSEYEKALTTKIFAFQFVNSYTAVLYTVFWEHSIDKVAIQVGSVIISATALDYVRNELWPYVTVSLAQRYATWRFQSLRRDMSVTSNYQAYADAQRRVSSKFSDYGDDFNNPVMMAKVRGGEDVGTLDDMFEQKLKTHSADVQAKADAKAAKKQARADAKAAKKEAAAAAAAAKEKKKTTEEEEKEAAAAAGEAKEEKEEQAEKKEEWAEVGKFPTGCEAGSAEKKRIEFPDGPQEAQFVRLTVAAFGEYPSLRCGVVVAVGEEEEEQEVNPEEEARSYSSVYADDAIGTGHARSRLDSEQAWSAKKKEAGEWVIMDLGAVLPIKAVLIQTRGGSSSSQHVTEVDIAVKGGAAEEAEAEAPEEETAEEEAAAAEEEPASAAAAEEEEAEGGGGGGGAGAGRGGGAGDGDEEEASPESPEAEAEAEAGEGDKGDEGKSEADASASSPSTPTQPHRRLSRVKSVEEMMAGENVAMPTRKDLLHVLLNDVMHEYEPPLHEYAEYVLQFGYIAMFTASFPLAPLLMLVTNMIQLRGEIRRYLYINKRGLPEGTHGIGAYLTIMEALAFFSTIVNCAQVYYVSSQLPHIADVVSNGTSCAVMDTTLASRADFAAAGTSPAPAWMSGNGSNGTALVNATTTAAAVAAASSFSRLELLAKPEPLSRLCARAWLLTVAPLLAVDLRVADSQAAASNAAQAGGGGNISSTSGAPLTAADRFNASHAVVVDWTMSSSLALSLQDAALNASVAAAAAEAAKCEPCSGMHCWWHLILVVILEHVMIAVRLSTMTFSSDEAGWVRQKKQERKYHENAKVVRELAATRDREREALARRKTPKANRNPNKRTGTAAEQGGSDGDAATGDSKATEEEEK